MLDAVSVGLAGLAVLAPSLLDGGVSGAVRDVGGVVVEPVITPGHRAAMAVLLGAIDGVSAHDTSDLQALHRFTEVRDALAPMRGPADDNPVMPAVTYADLDAIITAYTDAVRAGNAVDKASYSLVLGVGETVGNSYELVTIVGANDRANLTPLGQALLDALAVKDQLPMSFGSSTDDDPGHNMGIVARLAGEMDNVGYRLTGALSNTNPTPLDSVKESIGQLPATLDKASSAAADAVASFLGKKVGAIVGNIAFSTPVLVGALALIAWKVAK